MITIGIEQATTTDHKKLLEMHPIDLMKQVDLVIELMENYTNEMRQKTKARKKKPAKLFVWAEMWRNLYAEYGRWSHVFNKSVRENIAASSNASDENMAELNAKYKYVYAYWWNRFHYVEHIMKKHNKLWGKRATKNLEKARMTLVGLIKGEIKSNELSEKFKSIIESLSQQ